MTEENNESDAGKKAEHKAEELKGRAKEKAGDVTGNEQRQAEGKTEQTKGGLKQAADKIKGAFKRR